MHLASMHLAPSGPFARSREANVILVPGAKMQEARQVAGLGHFGWGTRIRT